MATTNLALSPSVREPHAAAPTRAEPFREVGQRPARRSRLRTSPTPHLTSDQYVLLLAAIDAGGAITIDAISHALPRVSQPVSAVFDLCDAGILNVDWESAFDGDMHVWRIDR